MKKIIVVCFLAIVSLLWSDQVLLYNFDFNESDQGWISSTALSDPNHSTVGVNDWEWGPADDNVPDVACEGAPVTNVWGTVLGGFYSPHSESRLYSPVIELPIGECDQVIMEICHYYCTEENYDGGNVVLLSANNPTGEPLVNPLPAVSGWTYDGVISQSGYYFACLVDNEDGFTGTSSSFVQTYFNLTPYQEVPFIIGLDFGADNAVQCPGWYVKWVKIWCVGPTDVDENGTNIKREFKLMEPEPNPAFTKTTIGFSLPKNSYVDVSLYDVTGRKVSSIFKGNLNAGEHIVSWNIPSSIRKGIYFVKLTAGGYTAVEKLEVLR